MRIFYFPKRLLTGLTVSVAFFLLGWLLVNPCLHTLSGSYKVREQFPPLVYVPGYERGPRIHAAAAILIESKSGAILYAKNEEQRRAPASTTKIMTAIVALEKGNLAKVVKVSRKAAATSGSRLGIRAGDRLSLKELLEGVMLQSGNDGSIAVAEGVAGSVDGFVALMNLKAKEIGALKTHFRNPHGLRAPSHYTTALDLALLARYGLADRRFAGLVSQKSATLQWQADGKEREIRNTNRLLWHLEGADGVKTGTTNEAGHCLVASATRDGRQYIAVALHSGDRWGDCARLLEYAFAEFTTVMVADRRQSACQIRVDGGNPALVPLFPRSDLLAVVRKGEESLITPRVFLDRTPPRPPLRPGQSLGKIGYQYGDGVVEGVDLIVNRPVRKRWWLW
jgi:D-alanyl-D-alanine carboxypeptidase (penicillin-binding protein 5/6)